MAEYTIDSLLKKAAELGTSDVHLHVGEVPAFRINGKIMKSKLPPITEDEMMESVARMAPAALREKIFSSQDADFPYEIRGVSRYRVNVAMAFGRHSMTIRIIPSEIPSFEKLGLPSNIEDFTKLENGIILVTGVTGSGKSTTIASILDYINQTKKKHIITIEDPIEYIYTSKKSIFTQRQVGVDTPNFVDGLKYALRQDPDIILVGEIRDMETVKNALHAAETGHLVLSTLHTFNAIQTFHRILGFFPPAERDAVRQQFAEVYRGSISQRLLPNAENNGRVCAVEVLQTTSTIKDFFIKDELEEIYKLVSKGSYNGMITFNNSLLNLYNEGKITQETALEYSDDQNELRNLMRGSYTGSQGFYGN